MLRTTLILAFSVPASFAQPTAPAITLPEMSPPALGKDSNPQEGVTAGTITKFEWNDSKIFPGTKRSCAIYVPAAHDPKKPTAVMVFQDGHNYLNPTGDFRATVVMDNLIHSGEIPRKRLTEHLLHFCKSCY